MVLTTIGYEGLDIDRFFAGLLSNGVDTIIDIREIPISHKPGFSKSALIKHAEDYHVRYVHFSELGCPKEIRHDYRNDKDWDRYTKRFLTFLTYQEDYVIELAKSVKSEKCCLLCFEADYHFCHRRYVAEALSQLIGPQLVVKHLELKGTEAVVWPRPLVGISPQRLTIDLENDASFPS